MRETSNFYKDTLAVIVIYGIEPERSSTYLTLGMALKLVGEKMDLLIYDNSPLASPVPRSENWTVHYEHDLTNGGVSKAYNRAHLAAKELGKKWLWLLDQDDVFDKQTTEIYQQAILQNPTVVLFAPQVIDERATLCSPFKKKLGGGWRLKKIAPGPAPLNKFLLINSGLLVLNEAFEMVGGYDAHFPMDFSDLDFIHRLRMLYDRFVILPITVKHSLSIHTRQSTANRLERFKKLMTAAKRFKQKYPEAIPSIMLRSFFMACQLSLRHFSISFVRQYFLLWK